MLQTSRHGYIPIYVGLMVSEKKIFKVYKSKETFDPRAGPVWTPGT